MPFPSGACLAEGAWLGVMTDGRQPLCGGNKGRAAGERAPHCAPAHHHATPRYGAGYSDGGKRPMLPDRLSQFRKAKTFLQDINVKCWQRFEFKTQNKPNNFTPEGHNDLPTSGPRHPLKKKIMVFCIMVHIHVCRFNHGLWFSCPRSGGGIRLCDLLAQQDTSC